MALFIFIVCLAHVKSSTRLWATRKVIYQKKFRLVVDFCEKQRKITIFWIVSFEVLEQFSVICVYEIILELKNST